MTRPASPLRMWAVVVVGKRSEWIAWHAIGRTRKEAWKTYCADFEDEYVHIPMNSLKAGRLRLARVVVQVEG